MKDPVTRRKFLEWTGRGAAALAAAPAIAPAILGSPPGETIGVGCIGIGVRGENLVEDAAEVPGVKVVAICDVYAGEMARREVTCSFDRLTAAATRSFASSSCNESTTRSRDTCLR